MKFQDSIVDPFRWLNLFRAWLIRHRAPEVYDLRQDLLTPERLAVLDRQRAERVKTSA